MSESQKRKHEDDGNEKFSFVSKYLMIQLQINHLNSLLTSKIDSIESKLKNYEDSLRILETKNKTSEEICRELENKNKLLENEVLSVLNIEFITETGK